MRIQLELKIKTYLDTGTSGEYPIKKMKENKFRKDYLLSQVVIIWDLKELIKTVLLYIPRKSEIKT